MYQQATVNEPIAFFDGQILFYFDRRPIHATGTASLVWLPSPRIEIDAEFEPTTDEQVEIVTDMELEDIDVALQGFGREKTLLLSRTLLPPYRVIARATSIESVDKGQLRAIKFPLVNGPEFLTPGLWAPVAKPEELSSRAGQSLPRNTTVTIETTRLFYDGWQINLVAATEKSHEVRKRIANSNGYAFTHIGQVSRDDGSGFSPQEADKILDLLSKFLSFLRGASCNFPILHGVGKDGQTSWKRFCSAVVDSGRKQSTWFEASHGGILPGLFEKFCVLCDGSHGKSSQVALHWYRECNKGSGGTESAIILGLTALELMSSLVLVEQKRVLSARKHKDLQLADKLGRLLREMSTPSKIPSQFTELDGFAQNHNWSTAYEALTKIRHSFVHSKSVASTMIFQAPRQVILQTWQLSL